MTAGTAQYIGYYEDISKVSGNIKVVFYNEKGDKLVRGFDSEYLADKFMKKLRYSKCTLVSFIKWV